MKSKYKTFFWLFTSFKFTSSLKVLNYQYKKMRGKLDYTKRFIVEFKYKDEKYKFVLRENGDDFAILRGTFMSEIYDVGSVGSIDDVKTIFDCGSHIGCIAVYYAKKYPEAVVHCFEPSDDSREMSSLNMQFNNVDENVNIHSLGISDKKEDIRFDLNDRNPSYSKINVNGKHVIHVDSIDNIMKLLNVKQVDLLKLDIEGYEIQAFKGMKDNFSNIKTIINENHLDCYTLENMRKVIEDAGYTILPEPKIWEEIYGIKNTMFLVTRSG